MLTLGKNSIMIGSALALLQFDDAKLLPTSNYQQIKAFQKKQFAFFGTFWTFFGIVLPISENLDMLFLFGGWRSVDHVDERLAVGRRRHPDTLLKEFVEGRYRSKPEVSAELLERVVDVLTVG